MPVELGIQYRNSIRYKKSIALEMDIGNAKLGALLSAKLVTEYFRGLQRIGTIPASISTTSNGQTFFVSIDPLEFELAMPAAGEPYGRLRITGSVTTGAPPLILPLDTWVTMTPVLLPNLNQPMNAAVLAFRYDGVDEPPAAPLSGDMVDQIFSSGPVATIFANVSLAILEPLIEAAGVVLFPATVVPPAGTWASALALMPADDADNTDSLGIFIDFRGGDANPADTKSILPNLTEFGIIYSRTFLDVSLAALNMVGQFINGAEITEFSLSMGNAEIFINGAATKDIADINFSGPITAQLLRGTNVFLVDATAIDVDVDLPWWADVFFFLAGTGGFLSLGLVPFFGGMVFEAYKDKSVSDAQAEIDAAPGIIQSSVSGTFARSISNLAQALSNLGSLGVLQPAITTESSLVEGGNIAVFAQVFVNPVTLEIVDGTFSRSANRLLELQLDGGRWFTTSELARIVGLGLITTPGYRAVIPHFRDNQPVRGYMQDEPDLSKADNLLTRFGS